MAGLIGNLLGTRNVSKQHGSQSQTTRRSQSPRQRQLQDILTRILTSQLVSPSNTAISVPFQQAVSSAQANMGRLNQQAAHGLAFQPPPDAGSMSGSFLPGQGGQQAGLQTREQLGLPDRASYLGPLAPSVADVQKAGVAPIRAGTPKQQRQLDKQNQLEQRKAALAKRKGGATA